MIQFNLLPDVKLEYVKAQRVKRAVTSGAVIATAGAVVIFIILFTAVHIVQKKIMSNQSADIKKYSNQLAATPDIDKILTIQNQLGALSGLHADKPAGYRMFGLLQQVTPAGVSLTAATTDFDANTIEITGQSASLDKVNILTDTLKFTKYTVGNDAAQKSAFSGVALSQFTRTTNSTFTVTLSYDPVIYNSADAVNFQVPSGISTQSVSGQPGASLFVKPTTGTN